MITKISCFNLEFKLVIYQIRFFFQTLIRPHWYIHKNEIQTVPDNGPGELLIHNIILKIVYYNNFISFFYIITYKYIVILFFPTSCKKKQVKTKNISILDSLEFFCYSLNTSVCSKEYSDIKFIVHNCY